MPRIKYKYDSNKNKSYEVYGMREYEIKDKDEDGYFKIKDMIEFLIWQHGSWEWVDANDCEPIE